MDRYSAPRAAFRRCLPEAWQLAAVGPVLCLHPAGTSALQGWEQATWASAACHLRSDGLCESLRFHDRRGECCWRLYLLPDTCFLAWEELTAGLCQDPSPEAAGLGQRLWLRLARTLHGGLWRARLLQFGLEADAPLGASGLKVVPAEVSPLGSSAARQLAALDGLPVEPLSAVRGVPPGGWNDTVPTGWVAPAG